MSVTLEQIDELRKRAKVSYEDAKEALEACDGDIVDALIYLEKQKKVKFDDDKTKTEGFFDKFEKLIEKGNRTKVILSKNDDIIIRLPVTIVIIATVIAPYFVIPGIIIALITGHRFRVEGDDIPSEKVNEKLDKISEVVEDTKKKWTEK